MVLFNKIEDIMLGIPLLALIVAYGLMFIGFAIKTRNDKEKNLEMKLNEITAGLLYFPAGFIILLISPLILYVQIATFIAFGGILVLFFVQRNVYNKLKSENDIEGLKERDLETFKGKLSTEYTLERDLSRKMLHTISPTVILICFIIGRFINPLQGLYMTNDDFTRLLIVILGGIFLILFASAELIRLFKFEYLPPKLSDMFAGAMKYHEYKSITATTTIILGLVPFLFLPLASLVAIGLTSALADAAASITGKRFGKHKFPKNSKKSVEGYIGGTTVAFLLIFIVCYLNSLFFMPIKPWDLSIVIIFATVGALVFLVIDIANPPIDDNIINPLFIGAAIAVTMLLIGLIPEGIPSLLDILLSMI